MSPSTKLLFRMIRVRLALGMGAAFTLLLILTLVGPHQRDPKYLVILPIVGFVLALIMRLHTRLGQTMFPVTDRQLAWIPMAAWGLVSLAGAAGLLVGHAFRLGSGRIQIHDATYYWLSAFRVSSSVLFLLLLMWRGVRLNSGFVGFLGFLPALTLNLGRGGMIAPWVSNLYLAGWPLWALGCVFLVWEAPRQTAVMRRLDYLESGSGYLKTRTPQLNGPARPTGPTRLADSLTGLTLAVVLLLFLSQVLFTPAEQIRQNPFRLFFLFLFFIPLSFLVRIWRANRASGLRPWRAFLVLLIEMTGVGYPFRDLLGVKRGAVVRCGFCGGWRMAWQAECPACGNRLPEHEIPVADQSSGAWSLVFPRYDQAAFMFRVMIPLLLLIYIIAFHWSRWFGG